MRISEISSSTYTDRLEYSMILHVYMMFFHWSLHPGQQVETSLCQQARLLAYSSAATTIYTLQYTLLAQDIHTNTPQEKALHVDTTSELSDQVNGQRELF